MLECKFWSELKNCEVPHRHTHTHGTYTWACPQIHLSSTWWIIQSPRPHNRRFDFFLRCARFFITNKGDNCRWYCDDGERRSQPATTRGSRFFALAGTASSMKFPHKNHHFSHNMARALWTLRTPIGDRFSTKNVQTARNFTRLFHFFHGRHHAHFALFFIHTFSIAYFRTVFLACLL